MFAIYKKELSSYFVNAIGYVYVGVFLCVSAFLCCYSTLISGSYDTSTYFTMLTMSFVILVPLLTMKLFAEEKKLRSEQLLLTSPVSITGMIMGKFLAAFTMFEGALLVSCINFFPLYVYQRIESANEEYSVSHIGPVTGEISRRPSGLRKTIRKTNSLAHRTTWLRSDLHQLLPALRLSEDRERKRGIQRIPYRTRDG